jgi:hypothetical protein
MKFREFAASNAVLFRYPQFPQLHREMCDWMEDTTFEENRLLMAYRHSGKSELLCQYVVWLLLLNPDTEVVIFSATDDLATKNSRLIKKILETNPICEHLLPERSDVHLWRAQEFFIRRNKVSKHASVQVASITGQITSKHGDFVFYDDIETAKNSKTSDGRQGIRSGRLEAQAVGDRHFYVGTPHGTSTIYDEIIQSGEWRIGKWPVLKADGEPQWPERHPMEWIERKRLMGDTEGSTEGWFLSQYMLQPANIARSLIDWADLQFVDWEIWQNEWEFESIQGGRAHPWYIGDERIVDVQAWWDPALGLRTGDNSVIAAVCSTHKGSVVVMDAQKLKEVNRNRDEPWSAQMEQIVDFVKRNHVRRVTVESNFNRTLGADLRKYARDHRAHIAIREHSRTRNTNKNEFIANQLEPLLRTGRLRIHNNVLAHSSFRTELEAFPNGDRDDTLDAIAGAVSTLRVPGFRSGIPDELEYGTIGTNRGSRQFNSFEPLADM